MYTIVFTLTIYFLVIKNHQVSGVKLEVKKAVSKDVTSASRGRRGGRGAVSGRGQNWGGPNNWGGILLF